MGDVVVQGEMKVPLSYYSSYEYTRRTNNNFIMITYFLANYRLFLLKIHLSIVLCLMATNLLWSQDKAAVLKVNLLLGEQTMTPYSPEEAPTAIDSLENVLSKALSKKGFNVFTRHQLPDTATHNIKNLYLIDFFIYAYPYDLRSTTITIRKKNYILYMSNVTAPLSMTKASYGRIALEAIDEIPTDIPYKQFLIPTIEGLIPHHMISVNRGLSELTLKGYKKNYYIELNLPSQTNLEFMLPESFVDYMSLCVNFDGARKEFKENPVELDFEIDPWGFTKIKEIRFPQGFPKKREPHIFKIEHSIPLWYNASGKTVPGTLKLGIKD